MRALVLVVSCGVVAGCGAPKEATDPSAILSEDAELGGAESDGAPGPAPGPAAAPDPARASLADCAAAARHLEALGRRLAIESEQDPKKRARLERELASTRGDPGTDARVQHAAEECVARGTSQREARCIAAVKSEEQIDACVSGD